MKMKKFWLIASYFVAFIIGLATYREFITKEPISIFQWFTLIGSFLISLVGGL